MEISLRLCSEALVIFMNLLISFLHFLFRFQQYNNLIINIKYKSVEIRIILRITGVLIWLVA